VHCYHCGLVSPESSGVPTCPEHGPLWKLVQQGPTANVIVERHGKVLLAKRGHNPWYGHWCIPGGFQDFGEHPEDAARREVMEEVGVTVVLTGLLGIYVSRYERPDGLDWIQTTVYIGTTADDPVVNDGEMLACGFFDPDALPEPMLPTHLVRLADWREGKFWSWHGHRGAGSIEE
jgi:8-oxo-dGTP diphosphatase